MTAAEMLLPVPAVTGPDACPTCGGRGEYEVGEPTRNYWGVWESDTRTCRDCAGSGTLPDWLLVCEECADVFPAEDQVCDHGMTLCGQCRGTCGPCAYVMGQDHAGERYDR